MTTPDEHAPDTVGPDGVRLIAGPDGLQEADNPMPRWMSGVYIATAVWSLAFVVFMPGIGLNLLGWNQYTAYEAELAEAKRLYRPADPAPGGNPLATALGDPTAQARGKTIFAASCAACHGPEAKGAFGPNLTDAAWLYGGKAEAIAHTISTGTPKGMPPFQASLTPAQLAEVTAFVHGLGGGK